MITAKEAREMSNKANEKMCLEAQKWVEDELGFIENHILNAIEKGAYRTSYYWSAGIFKEAGIKEENAQTYLKEALYKAGYCFNVRVEKRSDTARMIAEINWEEDNDE